MWLHWYSETCWLHRVQPATTHSDQVKHVTNKSQVSWRKKTKTDSETIPFRLLQNTWHDKIYTKHVLTILSLLKHLALIWNRKKRIKIETLIRFLDSSRCWHWDYCCISYLHSHCWCSVNLKSIACFATFGLTRITLKRNRGHNKAKFRIKQNLHDFSASRSHASSPQLSHSIVTLATTV